MSLPNVLLEDGVIALLRLLPRNVGACGNHDSRLATNRPGVPPPRPSQNAKMTPAASPIRTKGSVAALAVTGQLLVYCLKRRAGTFMGTRSRDRHPAK